MRCQNCGRELRNGARFCIACGAEHDSNGQLIRGGQNNNANYSDNNMAQNDTGFRQYNPMQDVGNNMQYNYQNENYDNDNNFNIPPKKKISPIIIVCPIIIIGAILFSIFGNKAKKTNKVSTENIETTVIEETTIQAESTSTIEEKIATDNIIVKEEIEATPSVIKYLSLEDGYWTADEDYYYIGEEMQKYAWIGDFFVGKDGKKLVSAWTDDGYYVDVTGKKAKNEWIEFSYLSSDGVRKIGFYYVDEEGKKVVNQTIEGRHLNEAGCYFPDGEDNVETVDNEDSIEKKAEEKKENEETKEPEKETQVVAKETEPTKPIQSTEQTQPIQATQPMQTMQPIQNDTTTTPNIINQTTINTAIYEQQIVQSESSVNAVASDGTSVAYNIKTTSFPEEFVTKFEVVEINDSNFSKLSDSINEWNGNRSHTGILAGEVNNISNASATYGIKVERNDGKIFSLIETKTKLDNNRAYETQKNGFTWDSKNGQMLSLEEIFNGTDKFSEFTQKVKNKLKKNKSSIDEDILDELMNSENDDLYSICTWYMTNKGITFLFYKENLGESKATDLTITLTYDSSGDNINKLLLTKYRYN